MHQKLRIIFWPLLIILILFAAIYRSHVDGDGVEYLLTAHAFSEHLSPTLTSSDFSFALATLHGGADTAARELVADLLLQLDGRPVGLPYAGFAKTGSGAIVAIHFWMYSLLAAPLYGLGSVLGAKPTLAFSLLNLTFFFATAAYLRRLFPKTFAETFLLLLAFGTIYYLRWSGPEVMTACSVLIASICVLRRDTALAIFLCAFASTQNPSVALMIPLIMGHRMCSLKFPTLLALPPIARTQSQLVYLAVGSAILASASYLFYYAAFGLPSLTGKYFANPALLNGNRAVSFVFDLNQGVIAGMPGLFVAAILLGMFVDKRERIPTAFNALFFLAAASIIAAPTLATTNWNSGASVMLRYAYWSCMPIVAMILCTLPRLGPGHRKTVVIVTLATQLAALLASGILLGKSSYIQHAPIARWVLSHTPHLYNPDLEIFFERTRKRETPFTVGDVALYVHKQRPTKLLRHSTNDENSGGICPAGQQVSGSGLVEVNGGWQYLHAPFRCVQADDGVSPAHLPLRTTADFGAPARQHSK